VAAESRRRAAEILAAGDTFVWVVATIDRESGLRAALGSRSKAVPADLVACLFGRAKATLDGGLAEMAAGLPDTAARDRFLELAFAMAERERGKPLDSAEIRIVSATVQPRREPNP
jgi:hypothetical protein